MAAAQSSDKVLRTNQTRKANHTSVTKPAAAATRTNTREELGRSDGSRSTVLFEFSAFGISSLSSSSLVIQLALM
jgi:hypothetical protein